ncbi:hypothetical protein [Spiroplasma endosymbiont of Clivina fossor]|uniref:hypothetical protein n=1 Tax=Spiroplasma endosymbiont of Clivina fossor TaxID=3066282 RepID=UPI00313DB15B
MNIYGKGLEALLSNFRWIEEINKLDITKQCKFLLEKEISNFKRLELSVIYGKGKYNFEIETNHTLDFLQN